MVTAKQCDPCCHPEQFANSNDSFKAATLKLICELIATFCPNAIAQVVQTPDGFGGNANIMQETGAFATTVEAAMSSILADITVMSHPCEPHYFPAAVAAAQSIGGAGTLLGGWFVYNPNATEEYIQIYDDAAPTVGTTVATLGIACKPLDNTFFSFDSRACAFGTACTFACTHTPGGAGAPGIGLDCNFFTVIP